MKFPDATKVYIRRREFRVQQFADGRLAAARGTCDNKQIRHNPHSQNVQHIPYALIVEIVQGAVCITFYLIL